jgi:hypothetical protein
LQYKETIEWIVLIVALFSIILSRRHTPVHTPEIRHTIEITRHSSHCSFSNHIVEGNFTKTFDVPFERVEFNPFRWTMARLV